MEKGIEQGIQQNTIEIAKSMLKKKYDDSEISNITNLSIVDIQKLKEELK